ncbi:cell filamentation protein Fic, partial [Arthrobacter sp. BL-252-APC-1A]|uniref:Fic family protein n=1 Tax=Arthrobacter sp. BL-252-APC-1A TaxID=2606622 RepID=UPI0012B3E541
DWAGEFRTINIGKNAAGFANIENGDLDQMLKEVQRAVGQVSWADLNADQFAMSSAALFSFVNHAHPFREGNGRTSKVFMEHVAEQSKFALDFSQVSRDLWNATSEASRPKAERPYLDPLPLVNVFALATKERGNEQTKETNTGHLDLSKASYPAQATKSLTKAPQGQGTARRGTSYLPGQNLGTHER